MKKNKYFEFKNSTDNSVDIFIYGEISPWADEECGEVSAVSFKNELEQAKGKDLNIYINSPGGSVFEGQAISEILDRHEGKKTCYIDGLCASIATKIPLVCDEVFMAKGAYFMIHNASGGVWGTAKDMRNMADTMDKINEGLVEAYMAKAKCDRQTIIDKMDAETWYTSADINNDFDFIIKDNLGMTAKVDVENLKNFKNVPNELKQETTKHIKLDGNTFISAVLNGSESKLRLTPSGVDITISNKEQETEKQKLLEELDLI